METKDQEQNDIDRYLDILDHASNCVNKCCKIRGCSDMKALIEHCVECKGKNGTCVICRRFETLLPVHASSCNRLLGTCVVPCCLQIKLLNATKPINSLLSIAKPESHCPSQRLILLKHVASCSKGGCCSETPHCVRMKQVLAHVTNCNAHNCNFALCASSKFALNHFYDCKDKTCNVCAPIRTPSRVDSHLESCPCCSVSRTIKRQNSI